MNATKTFRNSNGLRFAYAVGEVVNATVYGIGSMGEMLPRIERATAIAHGQLWVGRCFVPTYTLRFDDGRTWSAVRSPEIKRIKTPK